MATRYGLHFSCKVSHKMERSYELFQKQPENFQQQMQTNQLSQMNQMNTL